MRLEEIFADELAVIDVPFKSIFQNDEALKQYLFTEFKEADKIPSLSLFLNDNESRIEDHFSELKVQFAESSFKGTLSEKYFAPSMLKTPIVETLKEIEYHFKSCFKGQSDIEGVTYYAGDIIRELNKLKYPGLKEAIIEAMESECRVLSELEGGLLDSVMGFKVTQSETVEQKRRRDRLISILKMECEAAPSGKTDHSNRGDKSVVNEKDMQTGKLSVEYAAHIFANPDSCDLFARFMAGAKEGEMLAELSFIYRTMQKDGFIVETAKPSGFRDWWDKQDNKYKLSKPPKTLYELGKDQSARIDRYNKLDKPLFQ